MIFKLKPAIYFGVFSWPCAFGSNGVRMLGHISESTDNTGRLINN